MPQHSPSSLSSPASNSASTHDTASTHDSVPTSENSPVGQHSSCHDDIRIHTDRNHHLAASLYAPTGTVKAAVMIAPATGIKRQFYHAFASHLAQHGYGVISFDNEGIGGSLQGSPRHSDASLISWGRHDMPAVLKQLQSYFPDTSHHLVGHSAGGQLFGLMPNHHQLTSVFNIACSSGRIRNMDLPYRIKAMWFMDMFLPSSNRLLGYAATDRIGMGEPLPRNVAKQWRDWCNGQGYIKTAFGKTVHQHYYHEVSLPALWVNAPDDDIANDANVADMLSVFPNMQAQTLTLNPSDYGLNHIGHMKFFSRQSTPLWSLCIDWLDQYR